MLENMNIPEPICDGWWWRHTRSKILPVHVIGATGGWLYGNTKEHHPCACEADTQHVRYSGPIPVPEDKPTSSEEQEFKSGVPWIDALVTEHFKTTTPEERRRLMDKVKVKTSDDTRAFVQLFHSSASEDEDEDEGEKWGRRLEVILRGECPGVVGYNFLTRDEQVDIQRAALRFRDECIMPAKLVKAAELTLSYMRNVRTLAGNNYTDNACPYCEGTTRGDHGAGCLFRLLGNARGALIGVLSTLPGWVEPTASIKGRMT